MNLRGRISSDFDRRIARAFSLVEILVAMSILTLLLLLFTRIVGNTTIFMNVSQKSLAVDASVRLAIQVMNADILGTVIRPDVEVLIRRNQKGSEIYFWSESPGLSEEREDSKRSTISLIGYRVQEGKLERFSKEYSGKEIGSLFLPNRISNLMNSTQEENWQLISEAIFHWEFFFIDRKGNFLETPPLESYSMESYNTSTKKKMTSTIDSVQRFSSVRTIGFWFLAIDPDATSVVGKDKMMEWSQRIPPIKQTEISQLLNDQEWEKRAQLIVSEDPQYQNIKKTIRVFRSYFSFD